MNRRNFLCTSIAVPFISAFKKPLNEYQGLFDKIWGILNSKYCYFLENSIDWQKAKSLFRQKAISAQNNIEFKYIISQMLMNLFDAHTHVHNMPQGYERWPLYDIYANKNNGQYEILAIEEDSAAYASGLLNGDIITHLDGNNIEVLIEKYLTKIQKSTSPLAIEFAINQALAGKIANERNITINRNGQSLNLVLPLIKRSQKPDIQYKILENNIGYIAIRTFANESIIGEFSKAMHSLKNTKSIILDVRYNGGGDSAYARPIMGWFCDIKKPYAKMNERKGRGLGNMWTEYVTPYGDFTYKNKVIVLCNHWSASMAEGFVMGMRAVCNAKIIGTKMMGLGAAVKTEYFENIDLSFQFSYQPIFDINGKSRNETMPDLLIKNNDDFIKSAINYMQK